MPFAPPRARLLVSLAIALISIVYLAQIATPLRLVNDGVDYLLQASSAIDGHGFLVHGVRSMRPPGYPALIWTLAQFGIANSWTIVALNCLLLSIGCCASYYLLRDSLGLSPNAAQFLCLLTLASMLMVRNVTYPLSDICFFGTSVPCVLLLTKAEASSGVRRFAQLAVVIPLIILSLEIRTIGIVLLPAFAWAVIGGLAGLRKIQPSLRRYRFLVIALSLTALTIATTIFFHSRYWQFNVPIFRHRGLAHSIIANIALHTSEWGEITVNAPLSKLPHILAPALQIGAAQIILQIIGAAAILACLIGLWTKLRAPDSLFIYLLGFGAIVFVYPWADARLWLPILPFLIGYTFLGLRHIIAPAILRPVSIIYCALFCLLGIAALAYSTRLTFAGPRFPDLYGDGNFRATYKLVLLNEQPINPADIDPDALYLLHRYDRRASTER
jgi:hypothetical protein